MRKYIACLLGFLLLLPLGAALAETYVFAAVGASVALPDGVYDTVLTPETLASQEQFIVSKGGTVAQWAEDFKTRGVLLVAYDSKNDRVLEITALQDVDAKQYFDINKHTPQTRAAYRRSHGKQGAYAVLGYVYEGAEWKNFAKIGRFLMLKYAYRESGEIVHRGFQRRTIRNGYTITVDMKVFGRQLKAGDNSALNKVFDTFAFTQTKEMPKAAVQLVEKTTPPAETRESSFKLTGKTDAGIKLHAMLTSLSADKGEVFETVAAKDGKYSLEVKLPKEGVYVLTLSALTPDGTVGIEKQYSINYAAQMMPLTVDVPLPQTLTEDSFVLSGTTAPGASVQMSVNGETKAKKANAKGKFSFTIDTAKEGTYAVKLTVSKAKLDTKILDYTAKRTLSDAQRDQQMRAQAASPAYQDLLRKFDRYQGKTISYTGYVVSKELKAGDWYTRLALSKKDGTYTEFVLLTSKQEPAFGAGEAVRFYGVLAGLSDILNEDKSQSQYPRFDLAQIEPAAN